MGLMSASNPVFLLVWGHVWGLLVVFLLAVVVLVVLKFRFHPPDLPGLRLQWRPIDDVGSVTRGASSPSTVSRSPPGGAGR